MAEQTTGCAGKAPMRTLLAPLEKRFIVWLTPYFPGWTGRTSTGPATWDGSNGCS